MYVVFIKGAEAPDSAIQNYVRTRKHSRDVSKNKILIKQKTPNQGGHLGEKIYFRS